jgi:hypothetical protein
MIDDKKLSIQGISVDCINDVIGKIQANIHLPLAFIVNYPYNSLLRNRTINPCIFCRALNNL